MSPESRRAAAAGSSGSPSARRALPGVLAEMHVRLRTEGESPVATAAAVGLGTFIGCLPVYGAHLLLCSILARLFRISRIKTYLAAHLNNPLTAPLLLYLELGIGHWLFERSWPSLKLGEVTAAGAWLLGRDLLAGSTILGVFLGLVFGALALSVRRRWLVLPFESRLREETARRYLEAGISHWEFVHSKLRFDPVYGALVAGGRLPWEGRLVDLGCGRGIALALLETARRTDRLPAPPAGWRPPSGRLELVGFEVRPRLVAVARQALGDAARIVESDVSCCELPSARAFLLIDILHYLAPEQQEAVVRRVAAALEPGGVLYLREADAGLGGRFAMTRAAERLCALARGHWSQRFHYRSAEGWLHLLAAAGLEATVRPMWEGTPFANRLLTARRL